MGENPELIAMARRICANIVEGDSDNPLRVSVANSYMAGDFDNAPMMKAALAAIIETQSLIENFVGAHSRHADPADIASAIRSGQHYGKDHPHA